MSSTFTHRWLSDSRSISSAKKPFLTKYPVLPPNLALSERVEHAEFFITSWKYSLWCCLGELMATDLDIQTQKPIEILQLLPISHPPLCLPAELEYEHTASTLLHRCGQGRVAHTHFITVQTLLIPFSNPLRSRSVKPQPATTCSQKPACRTNYIFQHG